VGARRRHARRALTKGGTISTGKGQSGDALQAIKTLSTVAVWASDGDALELSAVGLQ
jgi:hypothetical protein